MWKNYFLVALRGLKKNKVFSFINIFGLALGITCSLLIMLWVQDERSIDNFHANGNRLFTVYERQYIDQKIDAGYFTPGLLAEEMKKVIPEVEKASGFAWDTPDLFTFEAGNKIIKQEGCFAGDDFLEMFSYPLLKGNAATALSSPVSLVISEDMATHFFGSVDAAIGKTMRWENQKDLTVTAVFANIPKHASVKFSFLINWATFFDGNGWAKEWGNNGPRTYLLLRADAEPLLVRNKIKKFLDTYNKEQSSSFRIELGLQRFGDMHLYSRFNNGEIDGGRIEYVKLFSLVAIFILLIACVNFMNLTTARSAKRAKEIGVRKVVGAVRSKLMRQFLGEALFITMLAVLLSLILLSFLLPAFNHLTGKTINLPFDDFQFWFRLIGLTFITGIIAGSYPSLFLSSFKPIMVLKGKLIFSTSAALFRKGLVIFQFVLSIVLIIGTIVVSRQIDYVQTTNLGYDRENLLYIPLEGDITKQYTVFKQEALKMPGIKFITRITQTPTEISNGTGGVDWDGKEPNTTPQFTQASIGYDFTKTMNLPLAEGRDLSRNFATDSVGYILNETALLKTGIKDPIGKRLTFWGRKGTIVGIVKDFHFASLHDPIKPLVLRFGENEEYGNVLVRTEPGKTKMALQNLEQLCKKLNPKFPFTYYFSDEQYQKLYRSEQVVSKLSNWFAFLAILISCLGLLGLAMFTAEQRTKEIGIRKVLGASMTSLFGLLSKDFLKLILISLIIASPLAWWAMNKWLMNFAYQIHIGWWVFILAGMLVIIIAAITVSTQAIRAAIANPVKALRSE
ncbi:MAG: ABC transporter permease [Chitinophagaceae bacterium]